MGWETDRYDLAACPCGAGRIVLERHSPDNGWSKPYDTTEIECSNCLKAWDVGYFGEDLTEKASQAASRQADADSSKAASDVTGYLNSILPNYPMPTFKTMGAEFDYLLDAGLYRGTVGQYRYARRSAAMAEIAQVQPDSSIIPKLIQSVGDAGAYQTLIAVAKAAKKAAADKSAAIKRIKIPKKF